MALEDLSLTEWLDLGVAGASLINDIRQDSFNRSKVRQKEQFNQALINIQKNALGSKFAMDNYQNLMQENVALGVYSSSLSKSRIGLAGTANQGITAIQTQYQKQRDTLLLQQTEQLAKLQLSELSSQLTVKAHRDKSVFERVGGIMNEVDDLFGDAISKFLNVFRENDSDHVFSGIGQKDSYENEPKDIEI